MLMSNAEIQTYFIIKPILEEIGLKKELNGFNSTLTDSPVNFEYFYKALLVYIKKNVSKASRKKITLAMLNTVLDAFIRQIEPTPFRVVPFTQVI